MGNAVLHLKTQDSPPPFQMRGRKVPDGHEGVCLVLRAERRGRHGERDIPEEVPDNKYLSNLFQDGERSNVTGT